MNYGDWVQESKGINASGFSLPHLLLSTPFSHFLLSHLSCSSFGTSSPPRLFHLKWGRGWFISRDCRGGWLTGGTGKNCLNAWQMMGQLRIANDCSTSLTFEVFCVQQNTIIASILHYLNYATSEKNVIMQCCFNHLSWYYTLRSGLQHIWYCKIIYIYIRHELKSFFLVLPCATFPPSLDASTQNNYL